MNKDSSGEDKDVAIHTPFGHVDVHNKGQNAADVGLPTYPGAVLATGENGDDKSVDVNVGFGKWKVQVQVANYASGDSEEKVRSFYKTALARYGTVLTCRGNTPVAGSPARTAEGLTCNDNSKHNVHTGSDDADLQLKAGSEAKQHIVAFNKKKQAGTHFALIAIELPSDGTPSSESREE